MGFFASKVPPLCMLNKNVQRQQMQCQITTYLGRPKNKQKHQQTTTQHPNFLTENLDIIFFH